MATPTKRLPTFQDIIHLFTRMVKNWRLASLLFALGLVIGVFYFVYGTPIYYSRSLVEYSFIDLPIRSEISDTQGSKKYQTVAFQLVSSLNSKWLLERTAMRLGLVNNLGKLEEIRKRYVQSIRVRPVINTTIEIEIYSYVPSLVRDWPKAMLAEYQDYLLDQRIKYRDLASAVYKEEMARIRENILAQSAEEKKFEEQNQLIENYIAQNKLEQLPSDMLTVRNQLDNMAEMQGFIDKVATTPVEKLALLKKYRQMPVPVGTIVRRGVTDPMVGKRSRVQPVPGLGNEATTGGTIAQTNPEGGRSDKGDTVVVLPESSNQAEGWELIERKLRDLKHQYDEGTRTMLPGHEKMRILAKQIEEQEALLTAEVESGMKAFNLERAHLESRMAELQGQMPEYRKVINDFDKYRQDFRLITSGNMGWEQNYAKLKDKLTAMEYTGPEMRVDFQFNGIVDLRDQIPVGPNKQKLLLYGLMLGGLFSIGGPTVLEKFRSTTSLVTETETITGINALGVIPLFKEHDAIRQLFHGIADQKGPGGTSLNLDEAFRILRCSIPLHAPKDNKAQVIMVCSSRPSEGKTTVASHLTRSFAAAQERTLLLDGDLRRGRIHRVWGTKNDIGMVNWLDATASIDDIVQKTELPNVDVIPRGAQSKPKFEMLATQRFASLIAELRQRYDRIIIDTPPILGLADSLMIQRLADGAVVVVRAEQTTQRDIINSLDVLLRSDTVVYGFVLNGVDLSLLENYYYYSTYYPRYYEAGYLIVESEDEYLDADAKSSSRSKSKRKA